MHPYADVLHVPDSLSNAKHAPLRPDVRLEAIKRSEQAATIGLAEPVTWLVPLVLALARLAAGEDAARQTSELS